MTAPTAPSAPPADSTPSTYVFGYGSLIEEGSRLRTAPDALVAFPARVRGLRRGWWDRGGTSGLTTTFLGAVADPAAACNGVLFKVTAGELQDLDARESTYARTEIQASDVTMLDGCPDVPAGTIYAYLNRLDARGIARSLPNAQFPIVQSYVDVCLQGCLDLEARYRMAAGFTQDFLTTTDGWNAFWVNDRQFPRRAFAVLSVAGQIDAALLANPKTAELCQRVELEPARWEDRRPVRPPPTRSKKAGK